ncbi:hypothetical protein FRB90_011509 [Tulasnella sp. 427]|nr:hypothetical protein FRB90_011509 [Tulasnella sp. 427]
MNTTVPVNAPILEVPQPPEEFCKDGAKFYRCYDALAEELDEDMVKGLKEQLDGMLIFAGLFAGVNSAFLALTLPLLSADPADDTNALLTHNNAILIQLLSGRNDTVPQDPALPSARFSPSGDIFTINTLFSLSLAFAIISSFMAVLGRQWLVYYRKREGGGVDRQRWEQLKQFLGVKRWRLEPILDDVLPSILQIGLIFCASLILYLRHLNPSISIIPPITPVPSSASTVAWIRTLIPGMPSSIRGVHPKALLTGLSRNYKRTICISDDPLTLMNAFANIVAINDFKHLVKLWSVELVQQRIQQIASDPLWGLEQFRGRSANIRETALDIGRLAAAQRSISKPISAQNLLPLYATN